MKRVIVVDDAQYIRGKLSSIIESLGHTVVTQAADGCEAIEKIKIHKPDIVTLDITMPLMGGIEVLEAIKAEMPDIKIIVIAANGSEQAVKEAVVKGADFFVMKPFNEDDIRKVFDIIIRREVTK